MLSILRHNQRKDPSNRKSTISTERRSTASNNQIKYLIAAGGDDVSGRPGEATSMEQLTQQLVAKQAVAGKPMNRSGFKARSISIDEVSSAGSSQASSKKEPEKLVGKVVDNELINQHMHDAFKKLGQEAK